MVEIQDLLVIEMDEYQHSELLAGTALYYLLKFSRYQDQPERALGFIISRVAVAYSRLEIKLAMMMRSFYCSSSSN